MKIILKILVIVCIASDFVFGMNSDRQLILEEVQDKKVLCMQLRRLDFDHPVELIKFKGQSMLLINGDALQWDQIRGFSCVAFVGSGSHTLTLEPGQNFVRAIIENPSLNLHSLSPGFPEVKGCGGVNDKNIRMLCGPENQALDETTKKMMEQSWILSGGDSKKFAKEFLTKFIEYGLDSFFSQPDIVTRADGMQKGNYAKLYITHILKHFYMWDGEIGEGLKRWIKSGIGTFGCSLGEKFHTVTIVKFKEGFEELLHEILRKGKFNATFRKGRLSIHCEGDYVEIDTTIPEYMAYFEGGDNTTSVSNFRKFQLIDKHCFPNFLHRFFVNLMLKPGDSDSLGSIYEKFQKEAADRMTKKQHQKSAKLARKMQKELWTLERLQRLNVNGIPGSALFLPE